MTDLHIDDFYKDTANILVALYKVFPRKHILYVEDICGEDTPDEYGLHSERFMSCFGTMIWLAEEGYIRFESLVGNEALDQAVISEQCFLLLNGSDPLNPDSASKGSEHSGAAAQRTSNRIGHLRSALLAKSSSSVQRAVESVLNSQ